MSKQYAFGTGLRRYLSTHQKIRVVVTFIGVYILSFMVSLIVVPHIDNYRRLFISVMISLSRNITPLLIYRLTKKPVGKFYTAILSAKAVHGEFSLGQNWGLRLFTMGMVIILWFIMLHTAPLFIRLFPVIIGIPVLIKVYYLALNGQFNQIIALKVDDEGYISFRRRDQDWEPLIITNYHKIVCEDTSEAIKISFFVANSKKPSFSIPISYVRSTGLNSIVSSEVMSAFFKEKCIEHRYDFNDRPIAWVATRHKQP